MHPNEEIQQDEENEEDQKMQYERVISLMTGLDHRLVSLEGKVDTLLTN